MEYLVFRLYGPMSSWGELAVGEARHSSSYPSKSAIVGLLGAALGLRREEDQSHRNLASAYQQAVKVISVGHPLKDYHTAQAPDSAGKFHYQTRRDEIVTGRHRLGTVLSSREYYTDAQAVVALKAGDDAQWSLSTLSRALLTPKFHLYLGRKACPLAAPLNPQKITTDDFFQALNAYNLPPLLNSPSLHSVPEWRTDKRWLPADELHRYYWEGAISDFHQENSEFSSQQVQQLTRRDHPVSKQRWQFQPREEYYWSKSTSKQRMH